MKGARFVLVDGRVAATWTTPKGSATVEVTPLVRIGKADRAATLAEAERLAAFLFDGDVAADARWAAPS